MKSLETGSLHLWEHFWTNRWCVSGLF